MKMFKKCLAATAVFAAVSAPVAANAAIIDNWNFNLSLINGLTIGGNAISGATNATGTDHLNVVGASTVQQTVVNNIATGQPFTDSGYLQLNTKTPEGGGLTTNLNFGTAGGNSVAGYIKFDGLTGVLNADGSITFDPGVGTITLYADTDLDPTNGAAVLATYKLIAPSGGSDLNFFGGGGANATVDVTLQLLTQFDPNFFTDSANNPLGLLSLHLVNTDSLLDPNYNPNPDNTGIDPITGNGVSIIHVQNNGQYNLETPVPEPTSVALMGIGLAALGAARRRKSA